MTYEIYNFGRPFLDLHYYTLSLSCLCLGVEKKNAFSLYDLYGHTLIAQEPLPQGVMKFTILLDPSLVIITTHLVCLMYAWE